MPATPEEGKHYYVADDASQEVLRCLVVLDDGRAVVATGGKAQVVEAADLVSVPTTVGDVLAIIGQLRGGKVANADELLASVEAWVRGIPAPDSEK
jgi:hypothetical protein